MFNFLQCFSGFTLILIYLKAYFQLIEGHDCRSKIIKTDSLYIDCIERNLLSIPQDFDENLEVLNISRNPLTELNENDLKKYVDLAELTMRELKIAKISPYFFGPTQTLKILDISSTCFNEPIPKLPISMQRIVANSIFKPCSTVSLPIMVELEQLAEFESRENNLNDFPMLPSQAPLQFIDLSKNPMQNLKYTDIAPLCVLSQLNLFGTELGSSKYHQQCCGLQKWGEKYSIHVQLECDKPCEEVKFDSKAIDAYNECSHTPGSSFFNFDYVILEILVFFAIILAIGYLAFRHFKSDAVKKHRGKARGPKGQWESQEEHEEEAVVDEEFYEIDSQ